LPFSIIIGPHMKGFAQVTMPSDWHAAGHAMSAT
jgi:hypothetical protein